MANIYQFSENEILAFILVFIRMSAFVVSWPVFGVRMVPNSVKILFSLLCAMIVFPTIYNGAFVTSLESSEVVFLVMREIFVGASLGFLGRLFFFAVSISGELASLSMGLSSSQLFSPATESSSSTIEQFKVALATLFFLAINGHHLFFAALIESYSIVPMSLEGINLAILGSTGEVVQRVMVIGVKLATPIMVSILFLNIAMAVVGRAVPQINVLVTSLPVNILMGFGVLFVAFPLLVWQLNDILAESANTVFMYLKAY